MGMARVTGKRKLTQRQKEIEESKSASKGSNARDEHIELNSDKMGRTRAAKKKKLTRILKETEESKSAPKGSNARDEHIEFDNNKMGRRRAAKKKKLAHIQKEIEESESTLKWSNARDEHIELDNSVRHEGNPQASKNIAIQTVVKFENNGARTESSSQATDDNAMQTEGNFDAVMDKKMGKARTMNKKRLTHKKKEIEESKSALMMSNAMAKHIEPDNDVHNEDDPNASKKSASLTVRRGRGRAKKKKLPHKQKEIDESKSTPRGSIVRNERIEPGNVACNEDNPHAFKCNAAQNVLNSENNSAQVEYDPQSFEDNAVQTEGSFEPVMEIEELIQDEDKNPIKKKRNRGPTKAERLYFGLASRIKVEFNAEGVPIGAGSVKLSSYLGPLVRKLVPVTLNDWRHVSDELKAVLWESIQANFKLDKEWQKKVIFQQMGCIWRSSKCRLVRKIIKAKTKEERFKLKPDNVESMEWCNFIESKTSLNFKTLSEKFKAMRSNQILHTCSRRGMARLAEDLKEKSVDPSSISRVQVWIKSRTRKNGEPVSMIVADTIEKIKKIENESASSSAIDVKENALSQLLRQDRRGRLKAMGRGKTLTNVTSSHAKDRQIAQFRSRISELEGMVHMLMKNQGNESLREESMPQMSKCGKISDKCDLLDWGETDEIVAEGRVVSSDPNELVHKVPLGPNAMKILILVSKKSDAFLWRPTPSLTYIGDAEDRTVAWPASRVVLRMGNTSSTDKKCKLYDWSGSEELVAEGRLCSSDPKQLVNDIPLGPSAMAVWVDDPKKRAAFLWRPTSGMTFVGEAVGKKVAWPKSNVAIENFNVVASLTPTITAAISPTTTEKQDSFLWRSTSGMINFGEAVNRKAPLPKSNVLIEKFNTVASPTSTVNATVSPMTTNIMAKNKCKLIDLSGRREIVAEGRVFSTDPNALVHFVPLGRNAVKVMVDFVKVPNAVLWRPSFELEYIEDAVGTTIAWPAANVIMESTSDN